MAEDDKKPAKEEPKKALTKQEKKTRDDEFKKESTIHVKIYSPFQTYYDDQANSISAENATGPFDILPQHHNFITLLVPCELDIRADNGDKKIKINRAVMHVRRNIVTIFLDV